MSELRRINVCLPGAMLSLVDAAVQRENKNRSAWIRSAVRFYLRAKQHRDMLAAMSRGYAEMGPENLALAELGPEDAEAWAKYEAFLAGETGARA
ncbi:MAG TPA: ribbon-helix-helix protein, CopG family [Firmicutes bacterium]|nr:ribbon-helix-helix protein, CopG family [Bacillota bacterium]